MSKPRAFEEPFCQWWLHMLFMSACVFVSLGHPVFGYFAGVVLAIDGVGGLIVTNRLRARRSA